MPPDDELSLKGQLFDRQHYFDVEREVIIMCCFVKTNLKPNAVGLSWKGKITVPVDVSPRKGRHMTLTVLLTPVLLFP